MDLFEKHFNYALKFLSYRPRSEKEARDRLLKKKIEPQIIDNIIARLKEHKFLDDQEFVKWWIEQRTKFSPKGLRLIKLELKQKGINADLIEKTINSLQLTVNNDVEKAKELVGKRIGRYKGLSRQELYNKLGPFLQRRGFDFETIKKTIDEILQKGV